MTLTRRIPFALTGLALATSFALALPNAAQADPRGHGEGMHQMRGGGEHRGGMGFLRGLDLTQEQRDQVFKIFHDQAPALRERAQAARDAREELRKLALAPGFDSAKARQLADTAARAQADVAVMRAEGMSKVVALLTPEQRTKLEQAGERGGHRGERGEHRGRRR
jgi:Spy/CpxP family protein refolding chaperone